MSVLLANFRRVTESPRHPCSGLGIQGPARSYEVTMRLAHALSLPLTPPNVHVLRVFLEYIGFLVLDLRSCQINSS